MITRASLRACLVLLAAPVSGAAQQPGHWHLTATVAQNWPTSAADNGATHFGPSPGLALGFGVSRDIARWQAGLAIETRSSTLRAADSGTIVEIPSATFARAGAVLSVSRAFAHLGRAAVVGGAGLRADRWSATGAADRWRLGGLAQLGLQYDAGPLRIENGLRVGLSRSPFEADDLPEGYRRTAMRWVELAVGASLGL